MGFEPNATRLRICDARSMQSNHLASGAILVECRGKGKCDVWVKVDDGFPPSYMVER